MRLVIIVIIDFEVRGSKSVCVCVRTRVCIAGYIVFC